MREHDYIIILKHYGVTVPKTMKKKKELVEAMLATKMCDCIKTVDKSSKLGEPAAIAICNKSIFRNRGFKYNKLKCKPKPEFIGNKKTKKKLVKTQEKLIYKKKKMRKSRKTRKLRKK